jgi:hypothetical protein
MTTLRLIRLAGCAFFLFVLSGASLSAHADDLKRIVPDSVTFPKGIATPSEVCGACHNTIYREFAAGFGSDMQYSSSTLVSSCSMPAKVSTSSAAHAAFAGSSIAPLHAPDALQDGGTCNQCHFPEPFLIPDHDAPQALKHKGRPAGEERGGLTCVTCHLTPDNKIRGPYDLKAPHVTVRDENIRSSAMCAYCHIMGKRTVGKQTQTYLEWLEDFHNAGLGNQECQDCHMFRTNRKSAEAFDAPARSVARHLWTGGHSTQRLRTALSLVLIQPRKGSSDLELHVLNVGAGHSVPTGSNRRAVYLQAEIKDSMGKILATREWMFAPWYADRPDDKAFLEQDQARPDAAAARLADAQGPHEAPIRAGEERVLTWATGLAPGSIYHVKANLAYSLNRYDRSSADSQTQIYSSSLSIKVDSTR